MSYFQCPHCNQTTEIFGHGGGERLSEKYNIPVLGRIPLDTRIRAGGDEGRPIVVGEPDSPIAEAFRSTVRQMAARLSVLAIENEEPEPQPAAGTPIQFFSKLPSKN
jgi:ATP-binding protein involved in chromosome partitioning